MWPGFDTREPKMAIALVFALALSLVGIYQGKLKPLKNKWLLILMGYLLINIWLCPKPIFMYGNIQAGAFWLWQPLAQLLIFFLMFATITSIEFDDKQKNTILKVMSWVGLVMAIYVILQFFRIDQFYKLANTNEALGTPSNRLGGTLGHPTLVSPFIAMLIPICLYLKKYWFAGIMVIAVLLTKSQIAIGVLVVTLIFFCALKNRKTAIRISILSLIFLFLFITAYFQNPKIKSLVGDSGRFAQWQQILKDVKAPVVKGLEKTYPFTGLGIGSFKYIYHVKNNNTFNQAHNEYLEILYNTGIIGLFLFLMALWTILKGEYFKDRYRKYLLTSFVCIAVCAGGTFVWQLGPHLYYTIVILALLNKENNELLPVA
jgi:O-antigen ligase